MRKRIFSGMCVAALIAVAVSAVLLSWMDYRLLYDQMKTATRNEAGYVVAAVEGAGTGYLSRLAPVTGARITYVDQDGTVLYDSAEPASQMENHADREEIMAAARTGYGDASRLSDTMRTKTYYYAVRLSDGTIIRVSNATRSVLDVFLHSVPLLILIIVLALLSAVVLARRMAKKIVRPINDLDLEHPLENQGVYDELAPFLSRIARQNSQIHEQLEAQQRQRREFAAITANMREGLIVLDPNAVILSANRSARKLLNIPDEPCEGKSVFAYCRSRQFLPAVEKVLDGQSADTVLELPDRALRLLANPSESADGAKGALLLLVDVTESHSAEQMRREFSANVSHELKTPLTSISGYAELMMNGMVRQEDVAPFAGRIYHEANRLIALVQDIIKLSRLDEGVGLPDKQPVELLELAQGAAAQLEEAAAQRSVTVSVQGEKTTVTGIAPLLQEMLYNLTENAVRYNKPGGRVTVTVGQKEGKPFFSVADTGIGIPKADQERVFERFYRVDSGRSKQSGGTGLGLSIVKHAARCHGAAIDLKSEEGKGTTITVTFPQ